MGPLRTHLSELAALIPPQQFYRYSDSFSRSVQQASFIIVFRVFLEREDVPSKEEVAQQLGSTSRRYPSTFSASIDAFP